MTETNGSASTGHNSAMRDAAIKNAAQRITDLKEQMVPIREEIAEIKDALKTEHEVSKSAFNAAYKLFVKEGAEQSTFRTDYDICCEALGILAGTPLGDAALAEQHAAGSA